MPKFPPLKRNALSAGKGTRRQREVLPCMPMTLNGPSQVLMQYYLRSDEKPPSAGVTMLCKASRLLSLITLSQHEVLPCMPMTPKGLSQVPMQCCLRSTEKPAHQAVQRFEVAVADLKHPRPRGEVVLEEALHDLARRGDKVIHDVASYRVPHLRCVGLPGGLQAYHHAHALLDRLQREFGCLRNLPPRQNIQLMYACTDTLDCLCACTSR